MWRHYWKKCKKRFIETLYVVSEILSKPKEYPLVFFAIFMIVSGQVLGLLMRAIQSRMDYDEHYKQQWLDFWRLDDAPYIFWSFVIILFLYNLFTVVKMRLKSKREESIIPEIKQIVIETILFILFIIYLWQM